MSRRLVPLPARLPDKSSSRPGILLRPPQWYRAVTASMLPPGGEGGLWLETMSTAANRSARVPGFGASTPHCRPDCAMSARIKRRWRGLRDGGRQTSPRRRSTGSGSDETGSLDEFKGRTCVLLGLWKTDLYLAPLPSPGRNSCVAPEQLCS